MKTRGEGGMGFGRDDDCDCDCDCVALRKRWRTPLRSLNLGLWDCWGAEKMVWGSTGLSASTE